jgi:hypothetical protein
MISLQLHTCLASTRFKVLQCTKLHTCHILHLRGLVQSRHYSAHVVFKFFPHCVTNQLVAAVEY